MINITANQRRVRRAGFILLLLCALGLCLLALSYATKVGAQKREPDGSVRIDVHPVMLDACGQQLIDKLGKKRRVRPCINSRGEWVISRRRRSKGGR